MYTCVCPSWFHKMFSRGNFCLKSWKSHVNPLVNMCINAGQRQAFACWQKTKSENLKFQMPIRTRSKHNVIHFLLSVKRPIPGACARRMGRTVVLNEKAWSHLQNAMAGRTAEPLLDLRGRRRSFFCESWSFPCLKKQRRQKTTTTQQLVKYNHKSEAVLFPALFFILPLSPIQGHTAYGASSSVQQAGTHSQQDASLL